MIPKRSEPLANGASSLMIASDTLLRQIFLVSGGIRLWMMEDERPANEEESAKSRLAYVVHLGRF